MSIPLRLNNCSVAINWRSVWVGSDSGSSGFGNTEIDFANNYDMTTIAWGGPFPQISYPSMTTFHTSDITYSSFSCKPNNTAIRTQVSIQAVSATCPSAYMVFGFVDTTLEYGCTSPIAQACTIIELPAPPLQSGTSCADYFFALVGALNTAPCPGVFPNLASWNTNWVRQCFEFYPGPGGGPWTTGPNYSATQLCLGADGDPFGTDFDP